MPISCLALNDKQSLRHADTTKHFMIELVKVSNSWGLYFPFGQGGVPINRTEGGGQIMKMSLQGTELNFEDKEEMDPTLRSTISQAIRRDPLIGCVWLIQ